MTMRRLLGPMIAWLVVSTPAIASACAVCTAGRDEENAFAFLMTTIFMSIMPLAAIGTLVFVLWRRIQKLEAEAAQPDLRAGGGVQSARSGRGIAPDTRPAVPHTS